MSRLKTQKLGVYGGVNKQLSPHVIPDDASPSMDNFILRPTGPEKARGWGLFTVQKFTDGAASPTISTILRIVQFFKSDGTVIEMAFTNHRAYRFRTSNFLWIPITPGSSSTTVNADSSSGQPTLNVAATGAFTVGEEVIIGMGTSREEYKIILSKTASSLTFTSGWYGSANLQFTHTAVQADPVHRVAARSFGGGVVQVDSDVSNDKIYFTNFVDHVQEWNGTTADSADVANLDQAEGLTGGTRVLCKFLRVFQNFLVLGYLNEGGTVLPTKIRWSLFGDFETWKNAADGSGQAGFATFLGPDFIEGMRQMKQELFFYRDRNIEGMTYVGIPNIFQFRRVSGQGEQATGLVGNDALEDFSDFHGFLGPDNVWLHDGISLQKIGDPVKTDLFTQLNSSQKGFSKVFWDKRNDELVLAFPTSITSLCPKAYVYSLQFNKWSGPRDFQATSLGRSPQIVIDTWDSDGASWDSDTTTWDGTSSNFPLILMGSNDGFIYQLDALDTKNGTTINASYRTKVTDCGLPELMKRAEKIYVGCREDDTTTISVYIGRANFPGDTIIWTGPFVMTLNAGSEPYVYPDLVARYFQVRIDATTPVNIREIEIFYIPQKFK